MNRSTINVPRLAQHVFARIVPDDYAGSISADETADEVYHLEDTHLYRPADNEPYQRGDIRTYRVRDVVGWPAHGAVRLRSGKLIEESFFSRRKMETAMRQGVLCRGIRRRVESPVAFLGHLYGNYYHTFIDCIPKIYALHDERLGAAEEIVLVLPSWLDGTAERIVRILVPPNVRTVSHSVLTQIVADECLILPYLSADRTDFGGWFEESAGFLPQEYLNWYRSRVFCALEIENRPSERRIFVSRELANLRRLENESEVVSELENHGFERICLERMELREQVQAFSDAFAIVAQHGAGLTNLVYAGQGARVLELMSDESAFMNYSLLSEAMGLHHRQIHFGGDDKNADIHVNPSALRREVEDLLAESG